jgi:hypothetical protein
MYEEVRMKRFLLALVIFMFAPLALLAQQAAPQIPFESVPNLLKLPKDLYLGEASGVAVNSKGHIFVFSRGNSTGPAYASTAAQLLEFGRRQEASDEGTEPLKHPNPPLPPVEGMFRQVADVTWNAAGDAFISGGYINSRVAKVDIHGRWLKSFGEHGSGPGQLDTPHSIAADAQGNVYAANRGNSRIEVYDGEGKYVREIKINVPFDYANSPSPIGPKPVLGGTD